MPKVTYIQTDGVEKTVDLPLGATIMEGAIQNDVKGIVAECGGSCMCATCHVYVDEAFAGMLPEKEEEELEMLQGANAELLGNSRLGCQIRISKPLDGMVVKVPSKQ
jgi:2Fe-2S ferredoxin